MPDAHLCRAGVLVVPCVSFVVSCLEDGCSWQQHHATTAEAERDGRLHIREWHSS